MFLIHLVCVCECRWLQWPSIVGCMQHAVHHSTCDKQSYRSFSNTVVLSSSQQSPDIPKRFYAASSSDVRWHSFLNTCTVQSRNVLACSCIDSFQQCRNSFPNAVLMLRLLHTTRVGHREPESKAEETLEALKDSVKKTATTEPSDITITEAKVPPKVSDVEDLHPPSSDVVVTPEKKKSLWARFKAEMVHYYHGFRLLFIDIRVAVRLIWQVLNGRSLVRRERQQVSFMYSE